MKERKRNCTAKCWQAKYSECQCVCGGKNHGEAFNDLSGEIDYNWKPKNKNQLDLLITDGA